MTMTDFVYDLDPAYPRDFGVTPSQTVGPYLHIGLTWPDGADVVPPGTAGLLTIRGYVYDGAGEPIVDAMVETWQADAHGRFAHPDAETSAGPGTETAGRAVSAIRLHPEGFRGFGRSMTRDGEYQIRTIKPGRVDDRQAPHIDVSVFARGMLNRCVTRIYFADEESANERDPVLSQVPASRRSTLIARAEGGQLRFDIRLQGADETVFFDL